MTKFIEVRRMKTHLFNRPLTLLIATALLLSAACVDRTIQDDPSWESRGIAHIILCGSIEGITGDDNTSFSWPRTFFLTQASYNGPVQANRTLELMGPLSPPNATPYNGTPYTSFDTNFCFDYSSVKSSEGELSAALLLDEVISTDDLTTQSILEKAVFIQVNHPVHVEIQPTPQSTEKLVILGKRLSQIQLGETTLLIRYEFTLEHALRRVYYDITSSRLETWNGTFVKDLNEDVTQGIVEALTTTFPQGVTANFTLDEANLELTSDAENWEYFDEFKNNR